MKKILLTCIAIVSLQVISHSQSFRLGLRAGVNLASVSGDFSSVAQKSNVTGLQAALVGELKFGGFSIVPEVVYSQQGVSLDGIGYKINNLNIPVLARFSLGAKVARVFLNTGPQFGLNLSNNFSSASLKTSDFAWVFGGGAGVKLGHGELFIDGRYTLGLTSISDASSGKNGVFGVSLGYAYKFGL